MVASTFVFASLACMIVPALALQVTANSECASVCMDDPSQDSSNPNASNTSGSDIVCSDGDYGSSAGQKFEKCLNCLQNSSAVGSGENDQLWFLYNLRFAFNTCIYGSANATDPMTTPCSTDTVCGPLQGALQNGMDNPSTVDQYSYCSASNDTFQGTFYGACFDCLQENRDHFYLSNFLVALQGGCVQQPTPGNLISLNGSVFSEYNITITAPKSTPTGASNKHKNLSEGAIIGISVSGGVLALIVGSIIFICIRKHHNAKRLKQLRSPLDSRFGAMNITAPNSGAYSSPETSPTYQKEIVPMTRSPKIRTFGFSRQASQRDSGRNVPSISRPIQQENASSNPPAYTPHVDQPGSIPTHVAYHPPQYSPQSRSFASPALTPASNLSHPSPAFQVQESPPVTPIESTGTSPIESPTSARRRTSNIIGRMLTRNQISRQGAARGPVQISQPIMTIGYNYDGEDAKSRRARLYREGLASTRTNDIDRARHEGDSSSSDEVWPGTF